MKGVNVYGPRSEFIVSGSDCGNVYIWHRDSEKIVNFFHADDGGVVSIRAVHFFKLTLCLFIVQIIVVCNNLFTNNKELSTHHHWMASPSESIAVSQLVDTILNSPCTLPH